MWTRKCIFAYHMCFLKVTRKEYINVDIDDAYCLFYVIFNLFSHKCPGWIQPLQVKDYILKKKIKENSEHPTLMDLLQLQQQIPSSDAFSQTGAQQEKWWNTECRYLSWFKCIWYLTLCAFLYLHHVLFFMGLPHPFLFATGLRL